uniref:(California timema) hypothetical protein n=1 Tax=Timema californicum TaxID=61474 RepID=A0A7R9P5A8_TIMCA|nr:unnamed protein product [Timema californicum]
MLHVSIRPCGVVVTAHGYEPECPKIDSRPVLSINLCRDRGLNPGRQHRSLTPYLWTTRSPRSEPAFAWRESGKPFRKNQPQFTRPIRTSISPSSAVELSMTSALANYATEFVISVLIDKRRSGRRVATRPVRYQDVLINKDERTATSYDKLKEIES